MSGFLRDQVLLCEHKWFHAMWHSSRIFIIISLQQPFLEHVGSLLVSHFLTALLGIIVFTCTKVVYWLCPCYPVMFDAHQCYTGTYIPRKEVVVDETIRATVIKPNQAIKLRARKETLVRNTTAVYIHYFVSCLTFVTVIGTCWFSIMKMMHAPGCVIS